MSADPKPDRRIVDARAGVEKVATERTCRVLRYALEQELDELPDLVGERQALTRHHIVSRAQGGDDVDDNLIPLGALTHDFWHTTSGERKQRLGAILRRGMTVSEVAYAVGKKGWDWFDSVYPEEPDA